MQSMEIGGGTAEKLWQALMESLWLIVGVKQMKQGPQSLAIGVPSGDIWGYLKIFACMICPHHMRESSRALGAALEGLGFQVSLCIMCFMSILCVCPEFLHLLCEGPHGGEDIVLMTMKRREIKYIWGTGQCYKLKPEWNKAAEFHGIYVEYESRLVDSAQWHEKLGRIQAKNTYCHHILTLQQLRAPQQQWLSRSYLLLWLLLIQQGSSLSPTFLMFLVFLTILPMLQKGKARWKIK